MEMHPFYQALDPYLIWFYRLTGHAGVDLVIGTLVLAFVALLIGEVTAFLAFWFTRKRVDRYAEEAAKYQTLSMDALKAGNKEAYTAANKLANEAFGHSFFQQLLCRQLSCGPSFSPWPGCSTASWRWSFPSRAPTGRWVSSGFLSSCTWLPI